MFKPRNTLVAVKLDPISAEKKVGNIVVGTGSDEFGTGVVVAVGPGTVHAEGGVSETADLHPGVAVLVKAFNLRPSRLGGTEKAPAYISYEYEGGTVALFEQSSIALILD
jgi:co-chaperonin GroES (HSP10)